MPLRSASPNRKDLPSRSRTTSIAKLNIRSSAMPEVHQVTAILRNPSGRPGDHGVCTQGYFTIEDGVMTMTTSDGKPVRSSKGELIKHRLRPGENRNDVAKRLTREVWTMLHGRDPSGGFNRPLHYRDPG